MAQRRRQTEESSEVRPVDVDGVRTVAIGTVLWAVAFVVLALRKDSLDEQGHGWWLWTCLAGVGLGLLGLEYTRKRRDAIALARLEEEADADEPLDEAVDEADVEASEEVQAFDVGPPIPAPTGRRARREAARTGEQPVVEPARFDEVDERVDTGELEETQVWDHTPGAGETAEPDESSDDDTGERARRRARRHASKGVQSTDSDSAYRGRRARRR